jgi:hypothetical protein
MVGSYSDETPDPVQVGLLGANRVVFHGKCLKYLVEQGSDRVSRGARAGRCRSDRRIGSQMERSAEDLAIQEEHDSTGLVMLGVGKVCRR